VVGKRAQTTGLTFLSYFCLFLRLKPAISRGKILKVNLASEKGKDKLLNLLYYITK
jgi:hypothetical protein